MLCINFSIRGLGRMNTQWKKIEELKIKKAEHVLVKDECGNKAIVCFMQDCKAFVTSSIENRKVNMKNMNKLRWIELPPRYKKYSRDGWVRTGVGTPKEDSYVYVSIADLGVMIAQKKRNGTWLVSIGAEPRQFKVGNNRVEAWMELPR